jgi:2'-hydroxyisoflavone reductase
MGQMILVLGGTRFLGRHIVEALAAGGHRVVCFHRGESSAELPAGVEERFGDRNADLAAVSADAWDAIVDVAAYDPAQLERSLGLRCKRYLFISTVSVYRDFSRPGITEDSPVYESFDASDEVQVYGGNKAACERLINERFKERATILRPGLIAGPWDYTGRFTYWCERAVRGGDFIAPAPAGARVQFVDARDVSRFAALALERNISGTFNVVGPQDATTMEEFIEACRQAAAERGAPPSRAMWIHSAQLSERGVQEWTEMPLSISDPAYRGIMQVDNGKARAAGLNLRETDETVAATMDWIAGHPEFAGRAGLSPQRERELLDEFSGSRL